MDREEKSKRIARWRCQAARGGCVVVLELTGINGPKHVELCRTLRPHGMQLRLLKNALARHALPDTPWASLLPHFRGPTALVLLPDDWHPALRALVAYLDGGFLKYLAKPNHEPNNSHIPWGQPAQHKRPRPRPGWRAKGAYLAGQAWPAEAVEALAALPTLALSRARLLGQLLAPGARLAATLQARPTSPR